MSGTRGLPGEPLVGGLAVELVDLRDRGLVCELGIHCFLLGWCAVSRYGLNGPLIRSNSMAVQWAGWGPPELLLRHLRLAGAVSPFRSAQSGGC
jgi:hypothetical protein